MGSWPGSRGQLGVHPEALRSWAKQAEIDGGVRPGTTTDDKQRIVELEKENRELRRANEILKAASAYFARELDVSIHGWRVIGRQASAGSGGSQGFPLSAARMASRARRPWFLAESR